MNQRLVFVDTSAWICFFARKGFAEIKQAMTTLLDQNRIAVAGPVVIELIQGCRNVQEKTNIEDCLQGLRWLEVRDHHWSLAAELSFKLRRVGITVSAMDALIATISIDYACLLLHRDHDYGFIAKHCPDLQLYSF